MSMRRYDVRILNRRAAARDCEQERAAALLELLKRSIKLGHRRLAIRRILMLRACSIELPPELVPQCHRLMAEAGSKELSQIHQSVDKWVLMLRPQTTAVGSSQA
jgi:hypothetical protein